MAYICVHLSHTERYIVFVTYKSILLTYICVHTTLRKYIHKNQFPTYKVKFGTFLQILSNMCTYNSTTYIYVHTTLLHTYVYIQHTTLLHTYVYIQLYYIHMCTYNSTTYICVHTTLLHTYVYIQLYYIHMCTYNSTTYIYVHTTPLHTCMYIC